MSVEAANPTTLQTDFDNLQIGEKLDSSPTKPATAEPRKLPFTQPASSAKKPGRIQLSDDEQAKYEIVEEHLRNLRTLPVSSAKKNQEFKPLSEREQFWLTRECILRYLRATKWNVNESKKRLEATIVWRREYGTDEITPELVEPEALTGKQILLGYDICSRPCLYLIPSRQNTEASPRQIQQLVYSLERAVDIMPQGVETLALLVDFKHSSNSKNPSAGTGRQVLHILQTHYPERLGKALVINVPTFVWFFFKLITPFIDPMTREKLKFNENLREYVPPEQLYELFGGDCNFDYQHEMYWPSYVKLAEERREKHFTRWKAAGGGIGQSEWDFKAEDATESTTESTVESAVEDGKTTEGKTDGVDEINVQA